MKRSAASIYFAFATLAIAGYYLLSGNAQSIGFEVIGASAIVAIAVGLRGLERRERLAWTLIGCGLAGEVLGDVVSTVYEVGFGHEAPVPSVADAFYLCGYPPLAAGIFVLVWRRLGGRFGRAIALDAFIVVAAVATVQWVFVIDNLLRERMTVGAHLVVVTYPAMDVLLFVALLQLVTGPAETTPRLALLTASMLLWIVADEVFLFDAGSYVSGRWLDAFWLGSYVLAGTAGLSHGKTSLGARDAVPRAGPSRLALLAGALLCVPVTLAVERFEHHRVHALVAAVGGAAIAALVVLRLADLLRAERETTRAAEEAQAHLRELDRLKDAFVASVSHELRTPLTSIVGYTEMLADEESSHLDPDQRSHVSIVQRNTQRLLALVNDLLFVAGIQHEALDVEHELVDLDEIVLAAVEAAAPTIAAAGLTLTADCEPGAAVLGDAGRLAQLADNLLSNAIKFTPEGGEVRVRVARRDGSVQLVVTDTGMGIPAGEQDRLFDRFFRSSNAVGHAIPGTGLGLHITKAIAEAHGGGIAVESSEGHGARIVVDLPAVPVRV
jgi:signal transduction histidine kinase